jgi:hypothetical protein
MDDEVKEQLVEEHGITLDLAEERAKVLQVKITKEGLLCT